MTTIDAANEAPAVAAPWAIEDLPPFPAVATRLLRLLASEDVNVNEVARTVAAEPVFAIRVLQLANSPLFAVQNEIVGIPQAIILLGLTRVRAITVTRAMGDFIAPAINLKTLRTCWRNSLAGALIAEELANISGVDPDVAYLAGLLRDIGRLALLIKYQREYDNLVAVSREEHYDLIATERDLFDIDHCEAGAWVVKKFPLPAELSDVIARHHEPLKPGQFDLVALVACADRMADALGFALLAPAVQSAFDQVRREFADVSGCAYDRDAEEMRKIVEGKIAAWA